MTDLKHSKEGLMEAFDHQLVYEVDMFYRTYNFLDVPAWSAGLANAIIESFCVHARNLIEFFDQESATPGQARSNYMGAKHFCDGYIPWTKGGPSNDLRGRLNRQISHLTYDRTSKEEEKNRSEGAGKTRRVNRKRTRSFRWMLAKAVRGEVAVRKARQPWNDHLDWGFRRMVRPIKSLRSTRPDRTYTGRRDQQAPRKDDARNRSRHRRPLALNER